MYIAVLTGFAWFACCIQISACFTWTKYPDSVTGVWNGSTVTLKWEYNLTTDEQNAANIAINRVWDRVNEKRLEFVASKNFITGSSVSYTEDLAPHIVISRSEEATLIINDVTKEDETVYKFTVVLLTLGNLRFARNFTLEVRVQPTLQCPETVIVTQGEQAIIPCNVTGDPKPNITWTKQSQSGKIISHNSTLVIDNAGISDNGIYNVIANNGRSASALMKLDIHFASMMTSVIVKRNPKNTTVLLNSSLTLLCVTNANPPALYHFYFNESYIGNSSSGEFNVTAKGDGVYTCVPINTVGTGNNGTLDINTVVRPLAEISQKIATAVEGGRLNLTCTASGKPEPKVAWTEVGKDDEIALTPSVSVIVGRPEIQDNMIQYRCIASNGVGTPDIATVNVTVYYKPYAKNSSDTVDVEEGGDISISCLEVIGNPPAAISWYRRNAACGDNNNRYLNFRNVTESDTGWYTCFAKNVVGNATFKVFVRVVPRTTPSTLLSTIPAPRPKTPSDVKSCVCSCKDVLLGSIIGVLLLVIFILFIYVVWLHKKETVRRPRACEDESGVLGNELAMKEFEPSRTDSSQFIQPHSEYMDLRQASVDNTIPPNVGQGGDYAPLHPSTRSWEVPRDHVTIEKIVGKGAFGQVARGKAQELRGRPGMTTVAIKMLKYNASESDKRDLMKELETMKQLKPHPHVIKLLGCVTQSEPFLVLIEYVPFGDLLGYLRKSRGLNDTYYKDPDIKPQTNLTTQQLMKCAWQIADGMSYLSSKSIIHRDLAARNVLVGEKETCKVTDFGMARNVQQESIYERKTKGRLPVKWTAYEALLYGQYTTKSDVWSFGVVLYEIFTIGGSPYPRVDGKKIANLLQQGYRMPKPQHVDDKLYEIMMNCWQDDPDGRPKFIDLKKQLKGMETSHKRLINMRMYDNEFYGNVEDLAE